MTRAFWRYPICWGPLDHSGSGSDHATTQARATLLLAIYELQYILQYIVINNFFGNHQLILVFLFLFSVALAQNTTGVTTATTMAAAGGNGPLAPHMRPCAPRQHVKCMGDNPLRAYCNYVLHAICSVKCSEFILVPAEQNTRMANIKKR
jgi:hypothetical protein